jgi:segregation and condensation protein A
LKYQVKLEVYEGPLDLLVRLVERDEISAGEISVYTIIEQFLRYFSELGSSDLEEGSCFLMLAAALLSLKAHWLLPQPDEEEETIEDEFYCEDEESLLDSSFEDYILFQEAAVVLEERAREWSLSYNRPKTSQKDFPQRHKCKGVQGDVSLLVRAFRDVLANLPKPSAPYIVESTTFDLAAVMKDVLKSVQNGIGCLIFRDLFVEKASREDVIITFLAVLELVFRGEIGVRQDQKTGEIYLDPTGA